MGVSEKRLLGWEPEERHEHYDAAGNLTGWTVVTRESEWDDLQRERLLALAYYERGVCECGFHESATNDKANYFTFDTKVCNVCRGAARMERIQAHADEQSDKAMGENPPPASPHAADGRRMFARQLSQFEAEEQRQPRRQQPSLRQVSP